MRKKVDETYPLTIYELKPELSLDEYKVILENRINFEKKKKARDSCLFGFNEQAELLYFSYVNEPEEHDVTWHKKWMDFFPITDALRADSLSGHGLIIISDLQKTKKFAIVFGRAYCLLKDYYIRDFGIKMATRLFDEQAIKSISSKYFSLIKSKEVIDYKDDYSLQAEEGQAVDFINARISEDVERRQAPNDYITKLLANVRPEASAGYSFIKITLSSSVISLELLVKTILILPDIQDYIERFALPVMASVNKATAQELDALLLEKLKAEDIMLSVTVPFFGFDDSDTLAFFGNIEKYEISYKSIVVPIEGEITQDALIEFILENHDQIDNIRDIQITVWVEGARRPRKSILHWLDVEFELNDRNYALYNGDWVEFNEVYRNYLDSSVTKLESDCLVTMPEFSFTAAELDEYKREHEEELVRSFSQTGECEISSVYREFVYNYILTRKPNWDLFDRIDNPVEICDVCIKDVAFVHVKIGNTSSIEAGLQQSMNGIRFIDSNRSQYSNYVNKEGITLSPANRAIVIFLVEKLDFKGISSVRSLKCKMSFVDWVSLVKDHKMQPLIIQAYYNNGKISFSEKLWERLPKLDIPN